MIEGVADRFNISPFDILQKPFEEVVAIWQGAVISRASRPQTGGKMGTIKEEKVERVYSWNANWH